MQRHVGCRPPCDSKRCRDLGLLRASKQPSSLLRRFSASRCEFSFNLVILQAFTGMRRASRSLDLAAQELVIFPRLLLPLRELAHQLSQYLRRRPVGRLGCRHELARNAGFQFHNENYLFRHDKSSLTKY